MAGPVDGLPSPVGFRSAWTDRVGGPDGSGSAIGTAPNELNAAPNPLLSNGSGSEGGWDSGGR